MVPVGDLLLTAATRFCPYCRQHKPDEGFKFVLHVGSGSKRGQCEPCQEIRKLPRAKLNELAKQEGDARRRTLSQKVKATIQRKRLNENTDHQ